MPQRGPCCSLSPGHPPAPAIVSTAMLSRAAPCTRHLPVSHTPAEEMLLRKRPRNSTNLGHTMKAEKRAQGSSTTLCRCNAQARRKRNSGTTWPRGEQSSEPQLTLKSQGSLSSGEGARRGLWQPWERRASPAQTAHCPQLPAPGLLPPHGCLLPLIPTPRSSPAFGPCWAPEPPLSWASLHRVHPPLENTWSAFSIFCFTDITLFPPHLLEKPKSKPRRVQRDLQQQPAPPWQQPGTHRVQGDCLAHKASPPRASQPGREPSSHPTIALLAQLASSTDSPQLHCPSTLPGGSWARHRHLGTKHTSRVWNTRMALCAGVNVERTSPNRPPFRCPTICRQTTALVLHFHLV